MPNCDAAILDAIRSRSGQASRKEIQQATGLSWGTMCAQINQLLSDGTLLSERLQPAGRGRPVLSLRLNQQARYMVGLDIGASQTKIVICDLAFRVMHQQVLPTPYYQGEKHFFAWLSGRVQDCLQNSGLARDKIRGLCAAVSGNVDSENGVLVSGGNFGISWGADLPLAARLSERCQLPVCSVTTQAAAAWAEYHFGEHAGCGNLVTIGLGVGIGSGVVANHRLLISQPGRPIGYIGHLLMPGNKHICTCGFRGCLEAYSGAHFLRQAARDQLPHRPELHDARALDQAAATGDPDAVEMMNLAASYNAIGIASMVQLYSPDAIVFSGGQSQPQRYVYQQTIQAINGILPVERRSRMKFSLSRLGVIQSALGAARLAYEKFI